MAEINESSTINNDQSGLLTATEMADKKKSEATKSLYLEDGERKIDCIIAYEVDLEDDDTAKKEGYRDTYFKNLQEKGLILEKADQAKPGKEEYGTFEEQKKQETTVHYYKVHAPFELLCDTAEDIKMKMPVRENDIVIKGWYETVFGIYDTIKRLDPFELRDAATKPVKNYFVNGFDKARLNEFIGHDNPQTFFTQSERSRLVYYIMENTKFGQEELDIGVYNLIHKSIIADSYPLHDGPPRKERAQAPINDRQALQADWATPRRIFKYQPIPSIKEYFGEKIALYFAWLGFYTYFLIPAAIVGILCFVYGVATSSTYTPIKELCNPPGNNETYYQFYMCPLCDKLCSYYLLEQSCLYAKVNHFFDNQATFFFAIFMSIWATLFLEFWKRRQVSLAYQWHTMDFEEEEERPRPEYLATVTRLKENPVTGNMEPYMPPGQRCQRISGAFGIVIFFIVLVLAAVVSVIVFRAAFYAFLIGQSNVTVRARSKIVVAACAACINLIAINLLKQIYQRIAVIITDWENPRTRTDYEDSFTVKMFWFQFANTYASIFYVAFFKSDFFTGSPGKYKRFGAREFRFEGCSVQGCFLELTIQLIIIMVGQQVIGNFFEIVIPYIKNKIRDHRNRNQNLYTSTDEPQWVTDYEAEMQTKFSLFWQYLEIVLQYGFVTMFVAAFPLAPLFAWINNMVEIRLDAVNFIYNFRRPIAERAEDIGAWYGILATVTTFSTLVNAFVLAYTSELIPHLVYQYYANDNRGLSGFTDWSLSHFPVDQFNDRSKPDNATINVPFTQPFCRYPGYFEKEAPFKRSIDYWVITAARLGFILCFQAFVVGVTWAVGYIIPDIPKSLELKIKRENFIASEMDKDHKEEMGKRKPRPAKERNTLMVSGEAHPGAEASSVNQQFTTYI